MAPFTPEATQLADRILEFASTVVDCLDHSTFANDRPIYTQDLALCARWLSRLHCGESVTDVAREIASLPTSKLLTDYFRRGEWGERQNAAAVALQKAASALVR